MAKKKSQAELRHKIRRCLRDVITHLNLLNKNQSWDFEAHNRIEKAMIAADMALKSISPDK